MGTTLASRVIDPGPVALEFFCRLAFDIEVGLRLFHLRPTLDVRAGLDFDLSASIVDIVWLSRRAYSVNCVESTANEPLSEGRAWDVG